MSVVDTRGSAIAASEVPETSSVQGPGRARSGDRLRRDRGVALLEFALILPFLALLVFGVVDLARAAQMQNRLSNSAREAAAVVQFAPKSVATGCRGGNNATDRAMNEDTDLASEPGYSIAVAKVTGGTTTPVTGCDTSPVAITAGDTMRVTIRADHDVVTPLLGLITGDPIVVTRTVDVVVQG
jgi:Flp pilus assembly protein TadG